MDRQKANEYARKYREAHREELREKQRIYREAHREILREKQHAYYRKNRVKICRNPRMLKAHLEWTKRNPEKNRMYANRRRVRKNNAPGSHTAGEIEFLRRISGGFCPGHNKDPHFVGPEALTVDHVVPLSGGGSDDISNIQMLCLRCNGVKGIN